MVVLNAGKDKSPAGKSANIVGPAASVKTQADQGKGQSPAAKHAKLIGPTTSMKSQGSGKGKGKAAENGSIIGPALPDRSHLPRVPIGSLGIAPMALQSSSTPSVSRSSAEIARSSFEYGDTVPVACKIKDTTKDEIKVEESSPVALPVIEAGKHEDQKDWPGSLAAFTDLSIDDAILAVLDFAASLKPKPSALKDARSAEDDHAAIKETTGKSNIASPPSPMSEIWAPAVQPAINGTLRCETDERESHASVLNRVSHDTRSPVDGTDNDNREENVPPLSGTKKIQKPAVSELYKSKWAPKSLI